MEGELYNFMLYTVYHFAREVFRVLGLMPRDPLLG